MVTNKVISSILTASYSDMVEELKAQRLPPSVLVAALGQDFTTSEENRQNFAQATLSACETESELRTNVAAMIEWAGDKTSLDRRLVLSAILADSTNLDKSYLFSTICKLPRESVKKYITDYTAAGGDFEDITRWIQLVGKMYREQSSNYTLHISDYETARTSHSMQATGNFQIAGNFIEDIWDGFYEIVDFILEAPGMLARHAHRFLDWSLDELSDFYEAIIFGGMTVADILNDVVKTTYQVSEHLIGGLLHYGIEIYELIEDAAPRSYWQLRRIVNGIIHAQKSVIDIFASLVRIAEEVGDDIWRSVITAVRFAMRAMSGNAKWIRDTLKWAASQGAHIVEKLFRAWENMGAPLKELYLAGRGLKSKVWEIIGEITARIGNSLHYCWHFVKNDVAKILSAFIRGIFNFGHSVVEFLRWSVRETVDVTSTILSTLKSLGYTLTEMMVEIVREPKEAMKTFLAAIISIKVTLEHMFKAIIETSVTGLLERITKTLVEMETSVGKILDAAWKSIKGYIGTVIGVIFTLLGTYRPMTKKEIQDAQHVFGDIIDYSTVGLATEGPLHQSLFAIQDFVNQNPESRPFVTNTLINFDPKEGIKRHTLVHELTHVWQFKQDGGRYMLEAVADGAWGQGYNYGYLDAAIDVNEVEIPIDYLGNKKKYKLGEISGEGAQKTLYSNEGNLERFNREQQAQILMHYFVRSVLLCPKKDIAAWLPYKQYVAAA